jgi:hypothetical protein
MGFTTAGFTTAEAVVRTMVVEIAVMPVMIVVPPAAVETADVVEAKAVTIAVIPVGGIAVIARGRGAFLVHLLVGAPEKRQTCENQSDACQRTNNLSHNGLTNHSRRKPK